MEEIKYHPLVDTDTNGSVKVPMFMSCRKSDMEKHRLYLEEIIPYSFRLCSVEPMVANETENISVHCPYCGKNLKAITGSRNGNRHQLFVCKNCT